MAQTGGEAILVCNFHNLILYSITYYITASIFGGFYGWSLAVDQRNIGLFGCKTRNDLQMDRGTRNARASHEQILEI